MSDDTDSPLYSAVNGEEKTCFSLGCSVESVL